MDLGIRDRVAIVTGASAGLGLAVAERLAQEGCRLALFARGAQRLEAAERALRARFGVEVLAVAGDMADAADVERLRDDVARRYGGPDILVINTGRPPLPMKAVLEERDAARWEEAYRVQLHAAVLVVQSIVPDLIARGWGRVVGITSASVKQPMGDHALSTVFRAGVTGMLKHLANEVAASGVTVNMVCPASVATAGLVGTYDAVARAAQVPMRRLGKPEELAATVAFLVSEHAGYTTGASLQVDGGMVAALT